MGSQVQSKQNQSSLNARKAEISSKKNAEVLNKETQVLQRPLGSLIALRPDLLQPQDLPRLQRTAGNKAAATLVQAKLVVGPAGDAYEDEADRIAAQVMDAQPAGAAARVTPFSSSGGGIEVSGDLETRLRAGQGGGSPLPADVRRQMEERFGSDFGSVRLHTDSLAEQLNSELRARAFTHGRDIFLGRKAADPGTPAGQRLLAHELTHVIQQSGPAATASTAETSIQRLNETEDPAFIRRLRQIRGGIDPDEDVENKPEYDPRIRQLRGEAMRARQLNRTSQVLENEWLGMGAAYTGYLGSALSLGGSISGTVNAYNPNDAASGYAGSGLGIAGSAVSGLASGFQLAGGISKLSRASRLMSSKSRAAQMLGKDLRGEGAQGTVESTLGVLGGLTGIGTNISGLFTTADSNNSAADTSNKVLGTLGAGLSIASEGAGLWSAGRKMMGGSERREAADEFFKNTHDIELAEIAKNTGKAQKSKTSLFGNLFKGALNVGSSILGVASAFSSGSTKAGLSLASTITGGAGALAGGVQTEYERFSGMKAKNRAKVDSQKLMEKIKNGDANAVKFANDVLKVPDAGKLAEEDPDTLKELLAGRMTQYSAS